MQCLYSQNWFLLLEAATSQSLKSPWTEWSLIQIGSSIQIQDVFRNYLILYFVFLVAQQLYIQLRLFSFFFFFFSFFLSVHGLWYAGLWKLWGAVGGRGEPGGPGSPQTKSKLKIHTKPNQTKTQSYNLCLTKPNQHWTAKPNQTGMAPQTKSKLTIPSKPNQTVFNQTQSKEFYQSKLNQFKPKPYKQNKNQPNQTRPKPTKPNRI